MTIKKTITENFLKIEDLEQEISGRLAALAENTGLSKMAEPGQAQAKAANLNPMALMNQLGKLSEFAAYIPELKAIWLLAMQWLALLKENQQLIALEVLKGMPNE